ncbi:acyl-CoA dehydrogenase family protein [Streptomyces sp. Q6]|uniref:Acyl-CoA dehydrogenase family protein n=1 Tax=Streptomyces citrinus TaxID=3118173 RepID=A0ACD5ALR9_9ACTN
MARLRGAALEAVGPVAAPQRQVEEHLRRLRMFRVLTGSSEIQKNGIARNLLMPRPPA